MAQILPRIIVMLHVAFVAIYLAWMRGGTRPEFYAPLPWLAFGLLEMTILFPLLKKGETDGQGRARILKSIFTDPVFYLGLILLIFLGIQCANGPRELIYDVESGVWRYSDPPWPKLPSCVDRAESSELLYWFAPVYAAIIAVRHALSRKAKMNLLRILVANGAILALFGIIQYLSGTNRIFWVTPIEVQFFASFGYPNHAGSFFTLMFAVSVGLVLHAIAEEDGKSARWLMLCLALNLAGATMSLCRAAICMSWCIAIFAIIYGFLYLGPVTTQSSRLRMGVTVFIGIGVAAFLYFVAYPENAVRREFNSIFRGGKAAVTAVESTGGSSTAADAASTTVAPAKKSAGTSVENPFSGDRRFLSSIAADIWKDYPWTGVGGWGFPNYAGLYVDQSKWGALRTAGRANVHNDFMQYLCETGILGVSLLLGTIVVLLVPALYRLFRCAIAPADADPDSASAGRIFIFRVSPLFWLTSVGLIAVVVHSLIDLPFRCPAVTVAWFICLASLASMLPKPKSQASSADKAKPAAHHHHHHHHSAPTGADGEPRPEA